MYIRLYQKWEEQSSLSKNELNAVLYQYNIKIKKFKTLKRNCDLRKLELQNWEASIIGP